MAAKELDGTHYYGDLCDSPHGDGYRLVGYLCPECQTWAEDMTPHCFNEHADDPVRTLPIYTKEI